MQATITYLLTEQAQRAAMVATGQPVARKQTMTIEVPAEDLGIFPVKDDGTIVVDVSGWTVTGYGPIMRAGGWSGWNGEYGIAANTIDPPFIADYKRGSEIVATREREKAETIKANGAHNRAMAEAAYQRLLIDPDLRAESARSFTADIKLPADFYPDALPELVAELARRSKSDSDAKIAAKLAAEAAKQEYISQWIADHGDDILRAQFADGLADRAQIVAMIAAQAFDSAKAPAGIRDSVVCDNSGCPCCENTVSALPTPVYSEWRKIKAGLPEGSSAEFRRVRDCLRDSADWEESDEDSASEAYYAADVTIPHGPFRFTRRIKLG